MLFLLPPSAHATSLFSQSLPDAWVFPKCNRTALRLKSATARSGVNDGWMPPSACARDDLDRHDPCSVSASSPVMIPTRLMEGAALYGERRRALEYSPLIKHDNSSRIVEVGILAGALTRWFISKLRPIELVAIDLPHSIAMRDCFGRSSGRALYEGNHTQLSCKGGDSSVILSKLPDEHYDLIYIDADHEYAGVCRDLEAAKNKVKVGGLLVFNDYSKLEWFGLMSQGRLGTYGVIYVVNEFLNRHDGNYSVAWFAFGPNDAGGDIALRRER